MKRIIVVVVACAAGVLWGTGVASAALSLQLGPSQGGYDSPSFPFPGFGVPVPIDLFFHETGAVQREGLYTYDVALDLRPPPGSGPLGVTFVTGPSAVQVVDPAAISRTSASGAPAEPSIVLLESTPQRLFFNVTSAGELSDIDEGEVAARVFYTYHPFGRPFDYHIVVDAENTVFASGDPNLPLRIDATFPDTGRIFYPPEPSCLSLVALGLLALRRRGR